MIETQNWAKNSNLGILQQISTVYIKLLQFSLICYILH